MRRRHPFTPARLLACAGLVALAVATPASANSSQQSIFQDDELLLYSGAERREATLDRLRSLGVDMIRAFVSWDDPAPDENSFQRPAGFDPSDPAQYPPGAWDRYAELVAGARARGMDVILTPTSPIPAWASDCGGSVANRRSCNPDPAEYGAFVTALGRRFADVHRWALLNEPNVGRWLTPQFVRRGRRLVPASPARYRLLAAAGIAALRSTGHAGDQILLAETAPIGHTGGSPARRPVATAEFLRYLFCLKRAPGDTGCRRPPRLLVTGLAHHPYIRGGSRAPTTRPRRDEITIANASLLKSILAAAGRRGIIPRNLPIYYTEFGFQTNPPDRILGVSLRRQVAYMHQSEWIAFRDPRVRAVSQYLLRDDGGLGGFQSGLEFVDGRPKPSLDAYKFPIWVVRRGVFVTVFGQVRHRRGAPGVVRVQVRLPGRNFTTYRTVQPNPRGFVLVRLRSRRGVWRLYWEPDSGPIEISREAQEALR